MIDFISGRVAGVGSRDLTISVAGIGFLIQVPDPSKFIINQEINLCIHWNWSSEKGPSLFGFSSAFERSVFCALIECPKIGPQISLQILANVSAAKLLEILALGDERALSSIHGMGPKKAKIVITELQEKAGTMLASTKNHGPNSNSTDSGQGLVVQEVILALKSMGYSAQEVAQAMAKLDHKTLNDSHNFTELTRLVLGVLLKQRSL